MIKTISSLMMTMMSQKILRKMRLAKKERKDVVSKVTRHQLTGDSRES